MKSKKQTKIEAARNLRKNQTNAEEQLWWVLRGKRFFRYRFRRQHIINGFILDFYCPKAKLGIELDGTIHLDQKDYDISRQQFIENTGIRIIRFDNSEVIKKPEFVISEILNNISLNASLSMNMERGDHPEQSRGMVGEGKK